MHFYFNIKLKKDNPDMSMYTCFKYINKICRTRDYIFFPDKQLNYCFEMKQKKLSYI